MSTEIGKTGNYAVGKKKRVLLDNGKFAWFTGPRQKIKQKSPEQKIQERKEIEQVALKYGFSPNNPEAGGLTDEDRELLADLPEAGKKALYRIRGVKLEAGEKPEEASEQEEEVFGLTGADMALVEKGLSIPEMKALAKKRGVEIPSKLRKSAEIKSFLLAKEDEGSEEDL